MLKSLKKNQNGIILITVLTIIIVIALLTISMVQLNLNQSLIAEGEAQRVQLEAAARGGLAFFYANLASSSPSATNSISYNTLLDGTPYTVTATLSGPGLAGTNTNALTVTVTRAD